MRKYDSYKTTRHEEIGKIPNNWEIKRLQYVSKIDNSGIWGANEPFENSIEVRIPTTAQLTKDGEWRYEEMASRHLSEAEWEYYKCVHGDIVVVKSSGSATNIITGKTGYISEADSEKFSFSNFLLRVRPTEVDSKFLYYVLQSDVTKQRIERMVSATTYPNLKVEEYIKSELPLPPPQQQTAIASYLDRKTAEIDELIADKKRLLELYEEEKTAIINQAVTKGINPDAPMKDSGIEWLGEIPEHWEVKKLKWRHQTTSGGTPKTSDPENYDGEIPWLRTLDLNNNHVVNCEIKITEKALSESSAKVVPKKSVLVAMYGGAGTIGKSGLLRFDAAINQAICAILPNEKTIPDFLHYFIMFFRPYWMVGAEGTRRDPNISQDDIKNREFLFPPIKEQQSIVRHIDTECSRIDTQMERTKNLIDLLTEYRTALISEVVTGKIKVTD